MQTEIGFRLVQSPPEIVFDQSIKYYGSDVVSSMHLAPVKGTIELCIMGGNLTRVVSGLAFGLYCTMFLSAVGPNYQPDSKISSVKSM